MKIMMTVFIMLGCPGSGKTWWTEKLGYPSVSRDKIRIDLGMCKEGEKFLGNKEQEDKVTEEQSRIITDLLESGNNFIIDDTNINPIFRGRLINRLKSYKIGKHGYQVVGIKLNTRLSTCLKRREGQIPEDTIRRMWERSQEISPKEFDQFIIVAGE